MYKRFNLKAFFMLFLVMIFICISSSFYYINIRKSFSSNISPTDLISDFTNYIHKSNENIYIDNLGIKILKDNNIKLQILNNKNEEVFNYNKPYNAPIKYTNETLINSYLSKNETLFIEDISLDNENYSCLLFFSPNTFERLIFTYEKSQLIKAHNFPLFIAILIIIILLISCIYLIHIIRPVNNIVTRIVNLSKGEYSTGRVGKGIYSDVRHSLNILSEKLYNNELEHKRLEEMRKEWISNISHDIKTPLTSIRGNAEIMSSENHYISDEDRIKYSNIIISKSDYIKNLVDDLNLSSRLKADSVTLNKININIVSLLRHVIIDIVNDDKYNTGFINFKPSKENIYALVDEDLIKRVFVNLIINAFVHNNYKVNIDVTINELPNSKVQIIIKDDGIGITKEDLKYIFERYFRGTNTSKEVEGSGLGMAIAKDIVKSHGGDIFIKSKVNEGTEITIVL